jgi:spermidine/putrescine transport system permease protein
MTSIATPLSVARRNQTVMRNALAYGPLVAWIAVLVLVPNALLVVYSLWKSNGGVIVHAWNVKNYAELLGSPTFRLLLIRTVGVAAGAATLAAIVAYPLAFAVWRNFERHQRIAVVFVVVPLWVSYLVRIFAWKIILGNSGLLNSGLIHLGILHGPSRAFLYNRFAVFLTLTYVAVPYVFVTSFTALERIPSHLLEASGDAGASPWRTFSHVVFPLSRQGLAMGAALAFLIGVGDYLTPQLVGGLNGTMLGAVISSQFGYAGNWSLGAAMAVVLLVVVMLFLVVLARLVKTEAVLE